MKLVKGVRENRGNRVLGITMDMCASTMKDLTKLVRFEFTWFTETFWFSIHYGRHENES